MAARVMLTSACLLGCLAVAGATTAPDMAPIPCHPCARPIAPPAYEWAARAARVPSGVLFAVAREESGMLLRRRWIPWPWTLNVAGVPHRFLTRAAACAALEEALKHVPARRIDVGLGQIDVGYFGRRVARPCDLLDPYRNLLLAATILRHNHERGEDWMLAVGRYHRPAGGEPAAQYRRDVAMQLARVLADAGVRTAPEAALP